MLLLLLFPLEAAAIKYFDQTVNISASVSNTSYTGSTWRAGTATHYGPWASTSTYSEPGYQPLDVGVGCSNGQPGGDPKWNFILSKGLYFAPNYPQNLKTIWPVVATVAVSEAVYGGRNKNNACWKTLKIRNTDTGFVVDAVVVDFCPASGCLWKKSELQNNVDIYGEHTWNLLGGSENGGTMNIQVLWPQGMTSDATRLHFSLVLLLIFFILLSS